MTHTVRNTFRMVLVSFVSLLLFAGCATTNDVLQQKKEGTAKVYPVNEDQAWKIARTVFRWEGADAIEEHRDEGYMLTSMGVNLVSYGAVMGAWVKSLGPEQTEVTVVTKRRIAVNLATTLTETTYHARFQQAVDIVKSGQPLPAVAP